MLPVDSIHFRCANHQGVGLGAPLARELRGHKPLQVVLPKLRTTCTLGYVAQHIHGYLELHFEVRTIRHESFYDGSGLLQVDGSLPVNPWGSHGCLDNVALRGSGVSGA